MMNLDLNAIIGACALLLSVIALAALAMFSRSAAQWRKRCLALEAAATALRREMELMTAISAVPGRQVKRIESSRAEQLERLDRAPLRGPVRRLEEAIDSARRGAEPVKLTRQFDLSRAEAELMARLYGQSAGA